MLTIRNATTADLKAATEILNELLDTTTYEWSEARHTVAEGEEWLAEHQRRGHAAIVAVDDGVVVGRASYGDFRDTEKWPGYLPVVEHSIHVARSHWGHGVGRALVEALTAHAAAAGKRVMVAAIDGTNKRSIAFHARLGFVEVGRMPAIGEKFGKDLDLVFMQRNIVR